MVSLAPPGALSLRDRAFVPVLLFLGGVVSIVSRSARRSSRDLAERLHVSLSSAQWALTATLVVAAVASPLVGRLGDGRHRKRVIVAAMSLVVLGARSRPPRTASPRSSSAARSRPRARADAAHDGRRARAPPG